MRSVARSVHVRVSCDVLASQRSLGKVLHDPRHYADASRQHRAAGRAHPEHATHHDAEAMRYDKLSVILVGLATAMVSEARPSQLSRLLRSSDPAVCEFVVMQLHDRGNAEK